MTSSMFLTAHAPNPLAAEIIRKTVHVDLSWPRSFLAVAPAGIVMLLAVPLLTYVLYPPEVKQGSEVAAWAAPELKEMGPLSRSELLLGILVLIRLGLWIFADKYVNATTAALIVIAFMLVTKVVTWDDMLANKQGWNTRLVRDTGCDIRRAQQNRLRQVVRRHHGAYLPKVFTYLLVAKEEGNASLSYQISRSDMSLTFGNVRPGSGRAVWHGSAAPSGAMPRNTDPQPFMQRFGRRSKS